MRVPRTLIGINASEQVGTIAKEYGAKKALLVSDPGIAKTGLLDGVQRSLEQANVATEVFSDSSTSAPFSSIAKCSKLIRDNGCDLVIGIGGGSVLDLVKLAVVVAAHDGDTSIIYKPDNIKKAAAPIILMPSTAGTGSEVSNVAVCTDPKTKRKIPVRSDFFWADAAIVDPMLTLNLPASITADTGMDVLSHAIEAYTSLKASIVGDTFAEKAIKLVAENLRIAYARGSKHIDARYNMAVAASFGILSLRSSGSYIVHSLSYPLGMKVNIGHGRACALMLPYVMDFNLIGNLHRFARVAELMGESTEGLPLDEKAKKSVGAVRELSTDVGLPQRLSDVGISKKDIPELVDFVFEFHSYQIENNPRELTRDDLNNILETAL
jgi:alcohol dehydrogenase